MPRCLTARARHAGTWSWARNTLRQFQLLPSRSLTTGFPRTPSEYLYWEIPEYQGQQALRMGKWKAVRKEIQKGNLTIELYDLSKDIREENDIATYHPEIIAQVEKIFAEAHEVPEVDLFKFAALGDK